MGATFAAHCLRSAWQSSRDRRLPFTEAQIKAMIAPTVKRMLKKARERNNSFYFERFPAGRLVPLALSVGPVPAFQITEAGLVLTNGEENVCLGYGGEPVSIANAPRPAKVAFNPAYLIDLHDALSAFDSAPGSPCGPLRAHDALAPFSIKSNKAMDSGDGFGFYAVVMPQRHAK
jgi:hypothetical protein